MRLQSTSASKRLAGAGFGLGWAFLLGLGACSSGLKPLTEDAGTQMPMMDASTSGPWIPGPEPGCPDSPPTRPADTPTWNSIASLRSNQAWYTSAAAAYVTDNIIYYQNTNGGWPKNLDMSYRYLIDPTGSPKNGNSLIDNGATTTQVRYLAYAITSWPECQRYLAAFNRGLDYLFAAQYPTTGGWPQVYPIEASNYSRRITYNDNAMVRVMDILRDIAYGQPLYAFVDASRVEKATTALAKGVDCILKTQIESGGKKTGWCAQHDEKTLAPVNARSYELASESGKEGAGVMAFLMTLDPARADVPREAVINAVEAAVLFYDSIKILGIKYVQGENASGAEDSWIEADPAAEPIWARFNELDAPFRPFFCDRDGVKKYSLAEIGVERRGGYSWYGHDPAPILQRNYPNWVARWAVGRNVLGGPVGPVDDAGAPVPQDAGAP